METSTAVEVRKIKPEWNCPVIVVATGPSLTGDVVWRCRRARWFDGWRIVCVNDAYRLLPHGDALYACDAGWWKVHEGAMAFTGEKWTTHEGSSVNAVNYKGDFPPEWHVNFVRGKDGCTFSRDPGLLHYGSHSGFQAINLAILKGATRIVLVGYDMRVVDGKRHYFGDHPNGLCNEGNYADFARVYDSAVSTCPVPIVNCTPGSALKAFPLGDLERELSARPPDFHPVPEVTEYPVLGSR